MVYGAKISRVADMCEQGTLTEWEGSVQSRLFCKRGKNIFRIKSS